MDAPPSSPYSSPVALPAPPSANCSPGRSPAESLFPQASPSTPHHESQRFHAQSAPRPESQSPHESFPARQFPPHASAGEIHTPRHVHKLLEIPSSPNSSHLPQSQTPQSAVIRTAAPPAPRASQPLFQKLLRQIRRNQRKIFRLANKRRHPLERIQKSRKIRVLIPPPHLLLFQLHAMPSRQRARNRRTDRSLQMQMQLRLGKGSDAFRKRSNLHGVNFSEGVVASPRSSRRSASKTQHRSKPPKAAGSATPRSNYKTGRSIRPCRNSAPSSRAGPQAAAIPPSCAPQGTSQTHSPSDR